MYFWPFGRGRLTPLTIISAVPVWPEGRGFESRRGRILFVVIYRADVT
jgi:hypothetical protein